jgi:hypothetical protein
MQFHQFLLTEPSPDETSLSQVLVASGGLRMFSRQFTAPQKYEAIARTSPARSNHDGFGLR